MADTASFPLPVAAARQSGSDTDKLETKVMSSSPRDAPTVRRMRNPVHPKIAAAGQRIISSELSPRQGRTSSDSHGGTNGYSSTASTAHARDPSDPIAPVPPPLQHTVSELSVPVATSTQPPVESTILLPGAADRTRDSSPRSPSSDGLESRTCRTPSEGSFTLGSDGEFGTAMAMAKSVDGGQEARLASVSDATAFVMPNINLPGTGEYTRRGRKMGCLNLLVSGRRGTGTTAFVRRVLAASPDVMHVDQPRSMEAHSRNVGPWSYLETRASTRPAPDWARRDGTTSSAADHLPDGNLCLVDAPCYPDDAGRASERDSLEAVLELLCDRGLNALDTARMDRDSLRSFLHGHRHAEIDAMIYLFSPDTPPEEHDWALLSRGAAMTTLIPVISHSDAHSSSVIEGYRRALSDCLKQAHVDIAHLNNSGSSRSADRHVIHAISTATATATDESEMDASVLMSETYPRSLVSSEVENLASQLFDPDMIEGLRCASIERLVAQHSSKASSRRPERDETGSRQTIRHPDDPQSSDTLQKWAMDLRRSMSVASRARQLRENGSSQASSDDLTNDLLFLDEFVSWFRPLLFGILSVSGLVGVGAGLFSHAGGRNVRLGS